MQAHTEAATLGGKSLPLVKGIFILIVTQHSQAANNKCF